ncbi:MAG: hypothetical protein ACTTH5_02600 [Wolinella sp.]
MARGISTLPLSTRYRKILATEVSKTSIAAAKHNCELNEIKNIAFARLNAKETQSALIGNERLSDLGESRLILALLEAFLSIYPAPESAKKSLDSSRAFIKFYTSHATKIAF